MNNHSKNNKSTINLTYKKQTDILLIDIEKNFCVYFYNEVDNFHIKIENHKIKPNSTMPETNQDAIIKTSTFANTIYTLIDKVGKWIKIAIQLLVVLGK
jgi:hypothetical protein